MTALIDPNNFPLYETNANDVWQRVLDSHNIKLRAAVQKLSTQVNATLMSVRCKPSARTILSRAQPNDYIGSLALNLNRGSRVYRECEALLRPFTRGQSVEFGVIKTFDYYKHDAPLHILELMCSKSMGRAIQSCAIGTPQCDMEFLQYHHGLGSACSRVENVQAASNYYQIIVDNYASEQSQGILEKQLHDIGRGQRWALQQDKKISDMLFDALIEYVRLNLFGHGERHYQRALSVLIWLSNESRFANHPGQEYVSNLNSEVVPLIKMRLNQYENALPMLANLYSTHKHKRKSTPDFIAGYAMEWTYRYLLKQSGAKSEHANIQTILAQYQQDYKDASRQAMHKNNYRGFTVSAGWIPQKLTYVPTREEFLYFVRRREPFIISMPQNPGNHQPLTDYSLYGGHPLSQPINFDSIHKIADEEQGCENLQNELTIACPPLVTQLGWTAICHWNSSYLCKVGGEEPIQLVLRSNVTHHLGVTGEPKRRLSSNWCAHVRDVLRANRTTATPYFDFGSRTRGEDLHYFPLNRLQEDIPIPSFLKPLKTEHKRMMTDMHNKGMTFDVDTVNLWFGGGADEKYCELASMPSNMNDTCTIAFDEYGNSRNCGLHYDAMDNMHFLIQGQKRWTIYSPMDASRLHYIAPVHSVSPDGGIKTQSESANLQFEKYGYNPRFSKVGTTRAWQSQTTKALAATRVIHHSLNNVSTQHNEGHEENIKWDNWDTYPGLKSVQPSTFDLKSGEALFLPRGWAHEVESQGKVFLSITYWSTR